MEGKIFFFWVAVFVCCFSGLTEFIFDPFLKETKHKQPLYIAGFYSGWLDRGNLGDELLFHICEHMFEEYGKPYNLTVELAKKQKDNKRPSTKYPIKFGILGGGSLLEDFYLRDLTPFIHNDSVMVFGSGFDNRRFLDDQNLEKLRRDEPFKWSHKPAYNFSAVQAPFHGIGIRGNLTNKALKSLINRDLPVVGDPGILAWKYLSNPQIKLSMQAQVEGKKVVTINWSENGEPLKDPPPYALNTMIETIFYLLRKNYIVVSIMMHDRDNKVTKLLTDELVKKIDEDTKREHGMHFFVDWTPPFRKFLINNSTYDYEAGTAALLNIYKHSVFSINYRLHASVLSLAAGTPFIALAYRFKVYDFVDTAGLSDYVVGLDENSFTLQSMVEKIEKIEQNENSIREQIQSHIADVQRKYDTAFPSFLEHLVSLIEKEEK